MMSYIVTFFFGAVFGVILVGILSSASRMERGYQEREHIDRWA